MSKSIAFLSLERRIDAMFARYTRPGSPGAIVAIAQGGEVEICKGYGLASIEHGVPIAPQTRFRIASVSKQFTVTTALLLAAEGKLRLSDPPHKYLQELKPLPVTIDQMMHNSSGLPDFLELLRLGGHGLDKGDKRLKPKLAPVTEAEIKPIAGTWFNADEPSLFDLAWRNGEATVTQNGLPFVLGRRPGGWFGSERGSFEFMIKPGKGTLRVDLGAGRVLPFKKLGKRKAVPAALTGSYVSADSGARWDIARKGENWQADVSGPLIAGGPAWPVRGVDTDTIETEMPGSWITATQLAQLIRDRSGHIEAIEVSTGRIKKMRFERAG